MSNPQQQQKPSQNPNQPTQGNKPEASKSWDKDAASRGQAGMKDQSSQPRDQFRSDAKK